MSIFGTESLLALSRSFESLSFTFQVKMTNENVREGNEQLLQATRSQSDFRVMSMIFLIGCSLTLLLLDAYK